MPIKEKNEHREKVKSYTFFGVLILITFLFFYSLRGLLIPIFLGGVLAIVLYPLYDRLVKGLKGRARLAALISIIIGGLVLLAILYVLASFIVRDATSLINNVGGKVNDLAPKIADFFNNARLQHPNFLPDQLSNIDLKSQIVNTAQSIGRSILIWAQSFTKNFLTTIALALITLYSVYYFLIDGRKWMESVSLAFPLPEGDENYLGQRFIAMVNNSLKVVFIIGAVEGILGGLIFLALGIPYAFFWGLAFGIFSLIPGLGHPLIWVPTAIILFITGSPVQAIILILYGMLVMGFADNLIRPWFLHKTDSVHPFLILISTLGGLATFGFVGLILGPVVASLFTAVWELYVKRYT